MLLGTATFSFALSARRRVPCSCSFSTHRLREGTVNYQLSIVKTEEITAGLKCEGAKGGSLVWLPTNGLAAGARARTSQGDACQVGGISLRCTRVIPPKRQLVGSATPLSVVGAPSNIVPYIRRPTEPIRGVRLVTYTLQRFNDAATGILRRRGR